MTIERMCVAFQRTFPTSVTKTRKFLATQAPPTIGGGEEGFCDILLVVHSVEHANTNR